MRPYIDCQRQMEMLRAAWPVEKIEQPGWGEIRLAAEVALAELRGQLVPTWVHERAFETLNVVAFA